MLSTSHLIIYTFTKAPLFGSNESWLKHFTLIWYVFLRSFVRFVWGQQKFSCKLDRVNARYSATPAVMTIVRVLVHTHYSDVIMGPMASQLTSLTIDYSTVYSGADQRKHQSSTSLAFVRGIHQWPVNFPHKWPVTRNTFPCWWRHHAFTELPQYYTTSPLLPSLRSCLLLFYATSNTDLSPLSVYKWRWHGIALYLRWIVKPVTWFAWDLYHY